MVTAGRLKRLTCWIIYFIHRCYCDYVTEAKISSPWIYNKTDFWDNGDKHYNISLLKHNWWEATKFCEKHMSGNLAILKNVSKLTAVDTLEDGFYWVGAISYSKWIWKDGSSLYTYLGVWHSLCYHRVQNLTGNSVSTCNQFCGVNHTTLGLKGTECYCLGRADYRNNPVNNSNEERCPGNFDDLCGNDNGMSVYHSYIAFSPESTSQCAYVSISQTNPYKFLPFVYTYRGIRYYPYIQPESDCSRNSTIKRYSASRNPDTDRLGSQDCEEDICVEYNVKTYTSASNAYTLLTVTPNNAQNLSNLMAKIYRSVTSHTFWIGLERHSEMRWLDGTTVMVANSPSSGILPICLGIQSSLHTIQFQWRNCSSSYYSVCEEVTAQKHVISTYSTSGHRVHGGPVGLYVGASFGVVIILVVGIMLIVASRQKRLCFKKEPVPQERQDVEIKPSSTTPVAFVVPQRQTDSLNIISTHENLGYCDLLLDGMKSKTGSKSTHKSEIGNVGGRKEKQTTPPKSAMTIDAFNLAHEEDPGYDSVNKLSGDQGVDIYTLAHSINDGEIEPYAVAKQTVREGDTPAPSSNVDSVDCEYNVLGQHVQKKRSGSNTYNRIGKTKPQDDYDTAGVSWRFQVNDDTYNHTDLRGDTSGCYDTVQRVQPPRRQLDDVDDDNYSHTNTVNICLDEERSFCTTGEDEEEKEFYPFCASDDRPTDIYARPNKQRR